MFVYKHHIFKTSLTLLYGPPNGYGFNSLIATCGTITLLSFSVTISCATVKVEICFMSSDDAPTLTV